MKEFLLRIEDAFNQPDLLFTSWEVIIRIVLTALFSYFALVVILRVLGNRSVANLNVYDFVATLTIGSIVASTLVLKEVTLLNGFTAVLLFLILQYVVSKLHVLWPKFGSWTNPSPKVLFLRGEFLEDNMRKARVNKEEVYSSIRTQARTTSDQVYAVILESSGSLSVMTNVSEGYEEEILKYLD